jgi:hypothetical protein
MKYIKKITLLLSLLSAAACLAADTRTPAIRKVSQVEARARQVIEHYSEKNLASLGILDVTIPPYSADNTGRKDVTHILQKAIVDARDAQLLCYLPAGKYLVSDTLEGIIGVVQWDNWPYEGHADPWVAEASFYYPCVLTGARGNERAQIVLADNAPGFGNPDNPKPVIHFWARSMQSFGPRDPNRPQQNINFNQKIMSIDIDLGRQNPGAIALDHRGAEGATVEDIRINAEGAFAGIRNAPGSGGAMHHIVVRGGRHGLYLSGSQPSPLVSDVKLFGQTESSIFCRTRGPLTVVGAEIDGAGIKGVLANAAWCGAVSIIDSIIRARPNKPAVDTVRSLVMDNVWVRRCSRIAKVHRNPPLTANAETWTHVKQYAAPGIQNYPAHLERYSGIDSIWINRTLNIRPIAHVEQSQQPPPDKMLSKHMLKYLPDWKSPRVVNVKEPPYNAKGNNKHDDTAAIQSAIDTSECVFLPKGKYRISRPLLLGADTKLFGLTNLLTEITCIDGSPPFSKVDSPAPLIRTVDKKNTTTSLQMMTLKVPVRNPCVYALHWRAGGDSIVRNIYPIRQTWHPHAIAMGHPMVVISDSAGGSWYTQTLLGWWSQGPDYRHLLVDGTQQPLRFYHLQPQHARSDAMIEMRNAKNIDIYSMKSEGDVTVLWFNQCENIRLFGYGGNGSPAPGRPIIRLDDCTRIVLANINPQLWGTGRWGALGIHYKPRNWNILRDGPFKLSGVQQFALFELK